MFFRDRGLDIGVYERKLFRNRMEQFQFLAHSLSSKKVELQLPVECTGNSFTADKYCVC